MLEEVDGVTDRIGAEVHFTHVGLVPQYDCSDVCSNAWAGYLGGSLWNLINTGAGSPTPGVRERPGPSGRRRRARARHSSRGGGLTGV